MLISHFSNFDLDTLRQRFTNQNTPKTRPTPSPRPRGAAVNRDLGPSLDLGRPQRILAQEEIQDALEFALSGLSEQARGREVSRSGSQLSDSKANYIRQTAVGSSHLQAELSEKSRQFGGSDADRIKAKTVRNAVQQGGEGNDHLSAAEIHRLTQEGDDGSDRLEAHSVIDVRQTGGKGNDTLEVDRASRVRQSAGDGDDLVRTSGSRDSDRIDIDLGAGDDHLEYTQTKGRDRVDIRGGEGQDSLRLKLVENGAPLILETYVDGKRETLYTHNVNEESRLEASRVTVFDVEKIEVLDPRGKPVKIGG